MNVRGFTTSLTLILILCCSINLKAKDSLVVTITLWKDSVIGAIYNPATHTVAYGKKDKKGYYKIYLSDTLGNNERRIHVPGWNEERHQWPEEWHPSGKYLFCYVEKSEYVKEKGHKRAPIDAIPGYGAYTDLWILQLDTLRSRNLTNLPNRYSSGIIHSGISYDGKKFAWSERVQSPKFTNKNLAAGAYVIRVADVWTDSLPYFSNIQTFEPGGVKALNEVESFSADNSKLAFYSTFESKNIIQTPVYVLDLSTGKIEKLTTESFSQAPTFTPNGQHIVYMTGHQCDIFPFQLQGADWWIMDPDGKNKVRLTYMNKKDHPHSVNKFRLGGSISFMSNTCFLGGVMTKSLGLTGYTAKVTFRRISP